MRGEIVKQCLLVLFLLYGAIYSSAQDKTLVGKITTFDSIPLVGANIQVKSSGVEVFTDSLGRFQVFCNPKDKIVVNADGFFSKKVKVQDEIRMILVNLNLKKGSSNLEKAERYVQVGYGHVDAKNLLYSISSANKNDIDFSKYDNMYDAVQGQFPGVNVENGNIIVRGTKTFYGAQGNGALVVIDGTISNMRDFTMLSPHDVSSIDVLKDGSAAAYGGRGANGVVIVNTKKGGER